jgi:mannose-1-phosphate guanylyltransferase/mannose-1-phosphate guanylyltransferase/mannose-6-phosphate isomerase
LGERVAVTSALDTPNALLLFDDSDDTAKDAIRQLRENYPEATIVFANGGDRTSENIPEMDIDDNNIEFVFSVGGEDKVNSSSWILDNWKAPKTERDWGYYRVLHEVDGTKVKELTVEPKQSLSMQKHSKRSEHWIVTEGKCKLRKYAESGELTETVLSKHDTITIQPDEWHQLANTFTKPCKIVEIQYGKKCVEEDIKRQNA